MTARINRNEKKCPYCLRPLTGVEIIMGGVCGECKKKYYNVQAVCPKCGYTRAKKETLYASDGEEYFECGACGHQWKDKESLLYPEDERTDEVIIIYLHKDDDKDWIIQKLKGLNLDFWEGRKG